MPQSRHVQTQSRQAARGPARQRTSRLVVDFERSGSSFRQKIGVRNMLFDATTRQGIGAALSVLAIALLLAGFAVNAVSPAEHTGFHLGWQPGTARYLGALLFVSRILIGRG